MSDGDDAPPVTIVVPVRNEAGNIAPLVEEIERTFQNARPIEVIYVDDGSSDATAAEIAAARLGRPWLRAIRHDRPAGQSAAVRSGVKAARANIIVSIDGDGQNDPSFIPALIEALGAAGPGCGLVQGQRKRRKSTWFKRLQSSIANAVRSRVLGDGTRDTGCGLKCFPRDIYVALPYFDALHRFMPALVRREGFSVAYVDVVDRPRHAGRSNYGFFDRLWVGIVDLMGVRWLIKRRRPAPAASEVLPP